jgi:homopolymeric O-antigen transport system permease protein
VLQYRYLFEQMVRRELRAKYKGSALGVLWYLVNPLVLMAVYAVMFRYLLKAVQIDDYPLFLFLGLIVWTFFSQSLLASATSLVDQAPLVGTVRFPRETVPAATVTVQLVPFLALLAIAVPVSLAVRDSLDPALLLLVPVIACLYLFGLGLALVVSVAHAHFRDVQPVLAAALLPWFFITPIFFRIEDLPGLAGHETAEALLRWGNPVAPFIEAVRDILYAGAAPSAETLLYVLAATAVTVAAGLAIFRRAEAELAVVL